MASPVHMTADVHRFGDCKFKTIKSGTWGCRSIMILCKECWTAVYLSFGKTWVLFLYRYSPCNYCCVLLLYCYSPCHYAYTATTKVLLAINCPHCMEPAGVWVRSRAVEQMSWLASQSRYSPFWASIPYWQRWEWTFPLTVGPAKQSPNLSSCAIRQIRLWERNILLWTLLLHIHVCSEQNDIASLRRAWKYEGLCGMHSTLHWTPPQSCWYHRWCSLLRRIISNSLMVPAARFQAAGRSIPLRGCSTSEVSPHHTATSRHKMFASLLS